MKSNDKLTKSILKIVRDYFNDIIKSEDIDLDNILLDEKSYENILAYNVS